MKYLVKKDLEKENIELRKKLIAAQNWMKREVEAKEFYIAKNKNLDESFKKRRKYTQEEIEKIILSTISDFLGESLLLVTPDYVIENIISGEVLYYNQTHYKFVDGLGVISSFHKAVDYLVEENITKQYRRYCTKNRQTQLKRNDPLEKSLNLVVNKGYTLSVGKLFTLISLIANNGPLYEYGKEFKNFLDEYLYIKEIILSDSFYFLLQGLINTKLFGEKRHIGKITFEETKYARRVLIGDFKDTNCIIFKLIAIGASDV